MMCMVLFGVLFVYLELTEAAYANLPLSMISGSMVPALAGVSFAQTYLLVMNAVAYYTPVVWATMYGFTGTVFDDVLYFRHSTIAHESGRSRISNVCRSWSKNEE